MPKILPTLSLIIVVLYLQEKEAKYTCHTGLPSDYIKWVQDDGALVFPEYRQSSGGTDPTEDSSEEDNSKETYKSTESNEYRELHPPKFSFLLNTPNGNLCHVYKDTIQCKGKDLVTLPSVRSTEISFIKQYLVENASLAPLPPSSFTDLNIGDLIISDSKLTYISDDAFNNIKHLDTLTISGNNIPTLNNINNIFKSVSSLRAIYFESNQLRNLNCYQNQKSVLLENLEFLSLANNPLALVNFECFSQTKLIYLNLKGAFVDEFIELSALPKNLSVVDLSYAEITETALEAFLYKLREFKITTLSLASLNLTSVPIQLLQYLSESIQYLSLSGNNFRKNTFVSKFKSRRIRFEKLLDLDLRNCKLEVIDYSLLYYFPSLEKLTLAKNNLYEIESTLFIFSPFLTYLDISSNSGLLTFTYPQDENKASSAVKVLTLNENYFNLSQDWISYNNTFTLLFQLEILSLCDSSINNKIASVFSNFNKLKILDLTQTVKKSNDQEIMLTYEKIFYNMSSLQELQFVANYFNFDYYTVHIFSPLTSLVTLNLTDNQIIALRSRMFYDLLNLKTLILRDNSILSWHTKEFSDKAKIDYMDLSNNQITILTKEMVDDFKCYKIINLNENPLICDKLTNDVICSSSNTKELNIVNWQALSCLDLQKNEYLNYNSTLCSETNKLPILPHLENQITYTTQFLILSICLVIMMVVVFTIRRNWWYIRHHIILSTQSSTSYLLKSNNNQGEENSDKFRYDVFVSYSDIDRAWVLDYFIPNLERDTSLNVCFHERDFQVGLSILENIIDSMSKSRCLMLIISESFVKSRWCQFEMHLAQHHAVENKHEQLVMVLLENIPKQSRPKTLHHLMCTRTYLLWPQDSKKEESVELFWKRLYRAIKQTK